MRGVSTSLTREALVGLFNMGEGDRKRGETGHRGLSFNSCGSVGFTGVGAWIGVSCCAAGSRVGVVVAERTRAADARPVTRGCLISREGLRSC